MSALSPISSSLSSQSSLRPSASCSTSPSEATRRATSTEPGEKLASDEVFSLADEQNRPVDAEKGPASTPVRRIDEASDKHTSLISRAGSPKRHERTRDLSLFPITEEEEESRTHTQAARLVTFASTPPLSPPPSGLGHSRLASSSPPPHVATTVAPPAPALPPPTWRRWAISGGAVALQVGVLCLPPPLFPLYIVAAGGCMLGAAMLTYGARYVALRGEASRKRQVAELSLHCLSVAAWTLPLALRLALPTAGAAIGLVPALAVGAALALGALFYRTQLAAPGPDEVSSTAQSPYPKLIDWAEALGYMSFLLPPSLWGGVPVAVGAIFGVMAGFSRASDPQAKPVLAPSGAISFTPGMADHERVLRAHYLTLMTAFLLRLITRR